MIYKRETWGASIWKQWVQIGACVNDWSAVCAFLGLTTLQLRHIRKHGICAATIEEAVNV